MKKICFITQCSLPVPTTKGGAVETLVEYIINENEINKKYEITVISIGEEKAKELSKKYQYTKFVYIDKKNRKLNKLLLFIYKILKHMKIYIPFSLEFKQALKELKKIENQDYYIFEAGPTTQLPALSKIIPKEKLLVHIHWEGMSEERKDKCFSYLIPVSEYIGKQWQKNTNRTWEKIKPLKNCVKTELFSKETSPEEQKELKKKLNIPENNKVIIYTGRIVKEKGILELLKAYEKLETKNITLLVIGSANFGEETNTLYEKLVYDMISKSNKSIIFTGFINQKDLYRYYNIADIAVMPSIFQDPAPLVCIETQATGTPLLATKVGGIPEYTGEDCAILIEKDENLINNLKEKMELLLKDEYLRRELSKAGKTNSLKYNTKNYYEGLCSIIDSIEEEKNNEKK